MLIIYELVLTIYIFYSEPRHSHKIVLIIKSVNSLDHIMYDENLITVKELINHRLESIDVTLSYFTLVLEPRRS